MGCKRLVRLPAVNPRCVVQRDKHLLRAILDIPAALLIGAIVARQESLCTGALAMAATAGIGKLFGAAV